MTDTLLDRRDLEFQLYEVLDTQALCERPRFREHDRATFDAVMDSADRLAREKFAPHNALADREEPRFVEGRVEMRPEVREAIDAYAEAGFIAGRYDEALGGMQLPESVMTACNGFFVAANPGTAGYPFLTTAAANVIRLFGSESQQATYLAPMLEGRFTGTMALTEPQAGSSLADLTTSARRDAAGHYLIRGSKLYISGGEHELSENIVHLVLARMEGAPAGVKGISMFIVPKYRLDAAGNPAERNGVSLAGLIHKLGYRGTTSTALSFGDDAPCHGYLVGEPNQGLKYMFQMMNEARLGVGFGATAIGYRGYVLSLDYARERRQGRPPSGKDPESAPVPLIEHADVRRMLLAQKSWLEGALALCLYGARLVDDSQTLSDREQREAAHQLLDLLTPVIKAWPSEYGTRANDLAIQVYGGAGYTREYPVEQCWRDNRLNPIHEGTNGIQALDLLGRKVWQERGLERLFAAVRADMAAARDEQCRAWAKTLGDAVERLGSVTRRLGGALAERGPDEVLANASVYLHAFGHVAVAWMWLRQANAAAARLEDDISASDRDFYRGKLQAARYFFGWELPVLGRDFEILESMDDACLTMKDAWF